MNNLKESKLRTLRNLAIVTFIFGGLSLYSFNCAPPSFQIADSGTLTLASSGEIITGGGNLDPKVVAPQALLTSEQIYESMMNLTGQKASVTNTQMQEFDRRSGSFSVVPDLDKVNAPMMIALTSFSGEVCNGLVMKEQALAAAQRTYFQSVNFGAAVGQLTDANYQDAVSKMANSFLGRAPSSEESTMLMQFKTDFIAAIPAAQITQTVQTKNLILATCSALLSSFDVFTY